MKPTRTKPTKPTSLMLPISPPRLMRPRPRPTKPAKPPITEADVADKVNVADEINEIVVADKANEINEIVVANEAIVNVEIVSANEAIGIDRAIVVDRANTDICRLLHIDGIAIVLYLVRSGRRFREIYQYGLRNK
jgi:hypothetical protein